MYTQLIHSKKDSSGAFTGGREEEREYILHHVIERLVISVRTNRTSVVGLNGIGIDRIHRWLRDEGRGNRSEGLSLALHSTIHSRVLV